MATVWSKYQEAVFAEIVNGHGNLVIDAVAGSGKSTTIVECLNRIPSGKKVLFCAFNKHIAEALKPKVPQGVEVATLNSFGFKACLFHLKPRPTLDTRKSEYIVRDFYGDDKESYKVYGNAIRRLMSLMKAHAYEPSVPTKDVIALADKFDVECSEDITMAAEMAKALLLVSNRRTNVIDFDDQIYLPVINKWRTLKYDYIFVDEAQDLNAAQMALIQMALAPNGRIVAVGDPYQAIYGFRGADSDAIPKLIKGLNAKVMPLSITYRCPKTVTQEAKSIVKHIECSDTAKDGSVTTISELAFLGKVADGDKVLCRTTAPCVHYCLRLIGSGRKATVLGRDIGDGLIRLINNLSNDNQTMPVVAFLETLTEYRDNQIMKLSAMNADGKIQKLTDDVETIYVLSESCSVVGDIIGRINTIFSDDVKGITLSTVHRAKGLEANNVFILAPELMPHPLARQDWQRAQEMNLKYVAITRSLDNLYWVQTPKIGKRK